MRAAPKQFSPGTLGAGLPQAAVSRTATEDPNALGANSRSVRAAARPIRGHAEKAFTESSPVETDGPADPTHRGKAGISQACRPVNAVPFLDRWLTLQEAAEWLQMSPEKLSAHSKGRRARIPGVWINARVVRFHPRTVIAKLADEAGVSPEVISGSLTEKNFTASHGVFTPLAGS